MIVGFDARALTSPAGGVRRYTSNLYRALAADYPDVRFVACGAVTPLVAGTLAHAPGPTLPTTFGWMLTGLPLTVRQVRPTVFHAPAYTAPLGVAAPLVLTVHDVSYARHPEWYPARIDPVRRWWWRRSATRATRVLTDSEFSRREIEAAYGIPPAQIDVAPLGVSDSFGPAPHASQAPPTVLHVGDLHTRRNLPMVLDVVLSLRRDVEACRDLTFTLVGVDRGLADALTRQAQAAGAPDALQYLGTVDEARLLSLYQSASVLAYPSRYEGFGLPALEAMACGLPVVAASAGSLPEVVGDAGVLVDPDDQRGWRDALHAVLTSATRRASLSDAGRTRSARFTWRATARATFDAFQRAAAASSSANR